MQPAIQLSPTQLSDFLLNVALVRPVFIWGAPGIGKSALVTRFAEEVGIDCVSLLGSQLAPEDLIGVPRIEGNVSEFCPPRNIARDKPYCLFLDELNACSHEVQKAFYSLIHERRIGEYRLPEGSVVIGAGNRSQDNAIVKPMSSALINRMVHVHLGVSASEWLEWAQGEELHEWVLDYIRIRPDHLWSAPPKHEEPFSSPRAWHMLSDALLEFDGRISDEQLEGLAFGTLSPHTATQFKGFIKQVRTRYRLKALIQGDVNWPREPEDRDLLYFLAQSLRAQLAKELPQSKQALDGNTKILNHRSKALLGELADISLEVAQMLVSEDVGETLPDWYLVDVVRDLPRLVQSRK